MCRKKLHYMTVENTYITPSTRKGRCLACRKYYLEANATKIKEGKRDWCARNPDYNKGWDRSHPEKRAGYGRAGRESNPEKKSAASKNWNKENPGYKRLWNKENPEKKAKYDRDWRTASPEKLAKSKKNWNEANPEKIRDHSQRRRARKLDQVGLWYEIIPQLISLMLEMQARCCAYCRKPFGPSGYELEHMTPISRGGVHGFDNIVLACPSCNRRKGTRTMKEYLMVVEGTKCDQSKNSKDPPKGGKKEKK